MPRKDIKERKQEQNQRKQAVVTGWAKENKMCADGYSWWKGTIDAPDIDASIKKLKDEKKYEWCMWIVIKIMSDDDQIDFAIYAFEQMINKAAPLDKDLKAALDFARAGLFDSTLKDSPEYAALQGRLKPKQISKLYDSAVLLVDCVFKHDETACLRIMHNAFHALKEETEQEDLMNHCLAIFKEDDE